jgi:mono/diheme cytochrome c family protein
MSSSLLLRTVATAMALGASLPAGAATPAELLDAYTAQAGRPASPERGQRFFNQKFGRDFENCAECHGAVPIGPGKDLASNKALKPMAPATNPARFTDKARVEYMFRINCKDVVGRDCTAAEKADLIAWLISLKP